MPSIYAKRRQNPLRLALVVFDGTKLLDVAGPLQVFSDARSPMGHPLYNVEILAERAGPIATDTVCKISATPFDHDAIGQWDTVLISGGRAAHEAAQRPALLAFVQTASQSARRLGSICLGAFVLAAGGHLAGRRATTHWDGCADLKARFPEIDVHEDALFVEDRGVWTSAGVTAGIDMALEMVRQDGGAAEALRLAKSLVLPVQRSGGQRQFSASLAAQTNCASTRFADLIIHISTRLEEAHMVPDMAAHMGMSERNFSRLFTQEVGVSPGRFVDQVRVEHAAALLHQGNVSLVAAQTAAGFTNAEQMRRAFQRVKGVSPSDYAAKFAG